MSRIHGYARRRVRVGTGAELELLLAQSAWARTVGLLAERELAPGLGLLIPRCSSVHTIGMRFALDVAFVRWPPQDGERVGVLSLAEGLRPWRTARAGSGLRRREVAALELAAGEASRLGIAAGGGATRR